jgi:hypothetical protein
VVASTGAALYNAGVTSWYVYGAPATISLACAEFCNGVQAFPAASPVAAEGAGNPNFALGLDRELDAFAKARNATTWKNFPNVEDWKSQVLDRLADPNTRVHFNLNGVQV